MSEKEKDLLLRVKNSDKKAFHNLFSNYHDTLFRFVAYRVRDSDLAEDITQETFLRVWKKRSSLIPKKSFFSLIARIATNLCYDHFRHVKLEIGMKTKSLNMANHIMMILNLLIRLICSKKK